MSPKEILHGYLKTAREALLWKLDGLSEYDVRRPLTNSGTNLLGIVKHVASVELGYFTDTFGRACPIELPWFADGAAPNLDMFATSDESRDDIVALYHTSWDASDSTIHDLDLDSPGVVPWWADEKKNVTLHQILVHMTAETNRHAGHADIVRELIDGGIGYRHSAMNLPDFDGEQWTNYVAVVQKNADAYR
ncbi:MAG: DUF664 domain-containing protein [Acidobacteria bacterium]|nr:DUF664 domain-containing protein [Acidobacteriota bacterium]